MYGMQGLHSDLCFDILLRLDVKTLGKCRCVCKTWKEVISSPCFISMHRDQSMLRNSSNLLLVGYCEDDHGRHFQRFTMVHPNRKDTEERSAASGDVSTICIESSKSNTSVLKLPVCCDLLCFWDWDKQEIKLCNPRTGQVHSLPTPIHSNCNGLMKNLVFGYDASKREYILVSVQTDQLKILQEGKMVAKKFTFSINNSISSSAWKDIKEGCPRFVEDGILINSFIYWRIAPWGETLPFKLLAAHQRRKNELIVSLNLDTQKFGIIKCPPTPTWESQTELYSPYITMIDFQGTLWLADALTLSRTNVFELWALKSNSCWVKKFNIPVEFPFPRSLCLPHIHIGSKSSKEGELIITSRDCDKFYVYNPVTNCFRVVTQPPQTRTMNSIRRVIPNFFWESLFSFTS